MCLSTPNTYNSSEWPQTRSGPHHARCSLATLSDTDTIYRAHSWNREDRQYCLHQAFKNHEVLKLYIWACFYLPPAFEPLTVMFSMFSLWPGKLEMKAEILTKAHDSRRWGFEDNTTYYWDMIKIPRIGNNGEKGSSTLPISQKGNWGPERLSVKFTKALWWLRSFRHIEFQ